MNENQLTSSNLIRKFGTRTVVDNVSFFVNSGEVVGLLGPNGAGKTTSFYMTVGLLKPSSGEVTIDGNNITELPIHKRARMGIGYLPQNSSVFRKLSVEDNLRAIMEVWGIPRNKRSQLLEKLIDQFGIGHIRKSLGISLSGGERRRLEIARTLVISPRFLLLDEPFAGIDPVTVAEIQELIKKLVAEENLGVLITDHNVRETLSLCSRAYILAGGKILAEGLPDDVATNEKVKQVYLGENFTF
ncbi:LPS export ABC transporter ATP-binding protein [Silvanigrella paludirubra]|uniref:Lipopolysaccharide export system ATP-binding protein LptB n=1 Tax=Silvanigrella paludirubra TaxID=2499159 RepID=A0A6N6VPR7_9BACT|nr:LPS export ABC transporter ATP-binding protein [Silvanigrella paludirubra]KAB8036263.1 LPS export ABC transporter ATP-binding protein [Silvanigrella paludirubra]